MQRAPIEIAREIVDERDAGRRAHELIEEFARLVPHPDPATLFLTDQTPEEIVRRAEAFAPVPRDAPDRVERLLVLVRRIRRFEGEEWEVDAAEDSLSASVPHPSIRSLLSNTDVSDEDVVKGAMSYEAVRLGSGAEK